MEELCGGAAGDTIDVSHNDNYSGGPMIYAETTRGEWVHAEYSEGITDGVPSGKDFIMVVVEHPGTDPSSDKHVHLDIHNAEELINSLEAAIGETRATKFRGRSL